MTGPTGLRLCAYCRRRHPFAAYTESDAHRAGLSRRDQRRYGHKCVECAARPLVLPALRIQVAGVGTVGLPPRTRR